jgi:hypothetical protein
LNCENRQIKNYGKCTGWGERTFYDLVARGKEGNTVEDLKDKPSKPKNPYRKLMDEDKAEKINLFQDFRRIIAIMARQYSQGLLRKHLCTDYERMPCLFHDIFKLHVLKGARVDKEKLMRKNTSKLIGHHK